MHGNADRICYPITDLDTKPGEESFVLGKTLNTHMRVRWIKLEAEVKPFLDGWGEFFFFLHSKTRYIYQRPSAWHIL